MFNAFFGIDLRCIINENKLRKHNEDLCRHDESHVECCYCHKMFRYGNHPSNNKSHHNFCCDDHRNKFVASFSRGNTKTGVCIECGKEVVADVHTPASHIMCSECRSVYDQCRRRHIGKNNNTPRTKKNLVQKTHRRPVTYCKVCGKETKNHTLFCSSECSLRHRYADYIKRWKLGIEDGMAGGCGVSGYIRRYLFEKYGNKCARCGWAEVNETSKRIPLQIDHIDGDYRNNREENLILLCPNCHSLTPTYMGLNRGHGRKERYLHDDEFRNVMKHHQ